MKLKRYTVFASWKNGGVEEIDVDAKNALEARELAESILKKMYMRGWKISGVEQRFGLYF